MGKKAVTLAALILLAACSGPERDAEQYLRAHYPTSTIEVCSAGEPRQLYTPFDVLNSLQIQAAGGDRGSDFYDAYRETAQALQDPVRFSDAHPELCNRKGFSATVRIDGHDRTVVFFYNRDGKTIGHTSLDLLDRFSSISHAH